MRHILARTTRGTPINLNNNNNNNNNENTMTKKKTTPMNTTKTDEDKCDKEGTCKYKWQEEGDDDQRQNQ